MVSVFLFEEVSLPCQYISASDPGLKGSLMGICIERRNTGVTLYCEIDFREMLHLLLIGHGASKVVLKEPQSFLPSKIEKRDKLV
jgi:hypothetical protein